eukprot:scaffold1471_cov413-Prasinococcus_capsulatus_cf.AAC.23
MGQPVPSRPDADVASPRWHHLAARACPQPAGRSFRRPEAPSLRMQRQRSAAMALLRLEMATCVHAWTGGPLPSVRQALGASRCFLRRAGEAPRRRSEDPGGDLRLPGAMRAPPAGRPSRAPWSQPGQPTRARPRSDEAPSRRRLATVARLCTRPAPRWSCLRARCSASCRGASGPRHRIHAALSPTASNHKDAVWAAGSLLTPCHAARAASYLRRTTEQPRDQKELEALSSIRAPYPFFLAHNAHEWLTTRPTLG